MAPYTEKDVLGKGQRRGAHGHGAASIRKGRSEVRDMPDLGMEKKWARDEQKRAARTKCLCTNPEGFSLVSVVCICSRLCCPFYDEQQGRYSRSSHLSFALAVLCLHKKSAFLARRKGRVSGKLSTLQHFTTDALRGNMPTGCRPPQQRMREMPMRRACARTPSPRSFLLREHSMQPAPSPLCGLAPWPLLSACSMYPGGKFLT